MNAFDWLTLIVCALLLLNKAARNAAFILLAGKLFYFLLIIDMAAIWYYSVSALLNVVMGRFLFTKYKGASFCAYSMVVINVLGFLLWYSYYPPFLYNLIFGIAIAVQLMLTIPREFLHGRIGNNIKHPLAGSASFDSCSAHATMCKIHTSKKTICAKK